MKRAIVTSVCAAAMLATTANLLAGPASAQVEAATKKVLDILKNPKLKGEANKVERRKQVFDVLASQFDFHEMSKLALGRQWRGLSEADRNEFAGIFQKLISNTYLTRLDQYADEKVSVDGERAKGSTKVVVQTRVITKSKEIPIDYSMKKVDGKWVVYDVKVEGVGLIKNYRSQFASFLKKKSYKELVEQLKGKVEKGEG